MGMAASQARFLNLTARRTNIEYEGQQINQQRTELSNESANLYNQMLSLQVPVPPNTQDYTKVEYSFMMPGGNDEARITHIAPDNGNPGKYSVVFAYTKVELGMPPCTDQQKSKVAKDSSTPPVYTITTKDGKSYTANAYVDNGDTKKIHGDAANKLVADGVETVNTNVYYINVGTEEKPKYEYYSVTELAAATALGAQSNAVTYYTPTDMDVYYEDKYDNCTINRDVQNRVQSFTYNNGTTDTTFTVTTNTTTDEDAYNDAMNEYTYQSYLYEQEMNNINAKTSIVQAQDRELELKLKQLDTEHNAVQTEMDAVNAVCKKNVEDSFKTFA